MLTINMKDARASFGKLVDRAQRGETIIITRHGEQAARVMPVAESGSGLPSLHQFRSELAAPRTPLSETVVTARDQERY